MLILANHVAPRLREKVDEKISAYLDGKISQEDWNASGYEKSDSFHYIAENTLAYNSDLMAEPQIRYLAARGFNVLGCRACPREIIEQAFEMQEKGRARELPIGCFSKLAMNPPSQMMISAESSNFQRRVLCGNCSKIRRSMRNAMNCCKKSY